MKSFEITMYYGTQKIVTTEHTFLDENAATRYAITRVDQGMPDKTEVKEVEFCRLVWD